MIPALQSQGVNVTYVPLMDYVDGSGFHTGALSAIMPELAALNGIAPSELSQNLLDHQDLVFFDQVHPNAAGYDVTGWTTIAAPKGLPKAVADKIQRDIEKALSEPEIKERYATFGYETFPATREQFNAFIQSESARYADVIKRAKASLD